MQIRMTDPAVEDIDENVLRAKIAAFEIKRAKRRSSAVRGVTFNRNHTLAVSRTQLRPANISPRSPFKRANASALAQETPTMITKNIGMLLLAIYLILVGITLLFHITIP